jgi:hypothetical protein
MAKIAKLKKELYDVLKTTSPDVSIYTIGSLRVPYAKIILDRVTNYQVPFNGEMPDDIYFSNPLKRTEYYQRAHDYLGITLGKYDDDSGEFINERLPRTLYDIIINHIKEKRKEANRK